MIHLIKTIVNKLERKFYSINTNIDDKAISKYKREIPRIILKKNFPLLLVMFAFMLAFSYTDFAVHEMPILFISRIPALLLSVFMIVIVLTNLRKSGRLVLHVNNFYAVSLLFMGLAIFYILLDTPKYRSGIIALIMLIVACYFFVKGFRSILLVFIIPFVAGIVYFYTNTRQAPGLAQELMNPITSYIAIIYLAFTSEKARYREFYYKKGLEAEKMKTERLYQDTLSKNEELIQLNENLYKAREKLEESNNTKNRLFSIIAHDLKGSFNVLIGFSNWLLEQKDELSRKEMEDIFHRLLKTSKDTFRLLENLLEWSMSQTGELEIKPKLLNVKNLLTETASVSESIAGEKNIQILIEADRNANVFVDPDLFATIMRNLFSNAIKYSHVGSYIKVVARELEDYTEIQVTDSGVGIAQNTLNQIFQANNKVSSPGTNKEKGSGLGLILCQDFVSKSNGTIDIESEINEGTTVKLKLPLQDQ